MFLNKSYFIQAFVEKSIFHKLNTNFNTIFKYINKKHKYKN